MDTVSHQAIRQKASSDFISSWFAMLQGAYYAATPVTVYYHASSYATCADLPTYSASPAPYYVMNRE